MDFKLSETELEIRNLARDFAEKKLKPIRAKFRFRVCKANMTSFPAKKSAYTPGGESETTAELTRGIAIGLYSLEFCLKSPLKPAFSPSYWWALLCPNTAPKCPFAGRTRPAPERLVSLWKQKILKSFPLRNTY